MGDPSDSFVNMEISNSKKRIKKRLKNKQKFNKKEKSIKTTDAMEIDDDSRKDDSEIIKKEFEDAFENKIKDEESIPKKKRSRKKEVFIPNEHKNEEGNLFFDSSAYEIYTPFSLLWPCLSFDFLYNNYEVMDLKRKKVLQVEMASGTQSGKQASTNHIAAVLANCRYKNRPIKLSNPNSESESESESESSSSSEEDEDEEMVDEEELKLLEENEENRKLKSLKTTMTHRKIQHIGIVNRLRCMPQQTDMIAVSGDRATIKIFYLGPQYKILQRGIKTTEDNINKVEPVFNDKQAIEGYALDWNPVKKGILATGNCNGHLHIYNPRENNTNWEMTKYNGHEASIEDIQWSPNEETVFSTCSVDKTVQIWDTRQMSKSMITVNAHKCDVNVMSWNRIKTHLLVSGDDKGIFKVWDLRNLSKSEHIAKFNYHKKSINSIEWCPHDETVLATCSDDNQLLIWDLSLERDPEEERACAIKENAKLNKKIPDQLLFIHSGQNDMKELHWHKNIPGLIGCTSGDGFCLFKPSNIL